MTDINRWPYYFVDIIFDCNLKKCILLINIYKNICSSINRLLWFGRTFKLIHQWFHYLKNADILKLFFFEWHQMLNKSSVQFRSKTQWGVHGNSSILSPWLYLELFLSWTSFLVSSAGEYCVLSGWVWCKKKKLRLVSLDRLLDFLILLYLQDLLEVTPVKIIYLENLMLVPMDCAMKMVA